MITNRIILNEKFCKPRELTVKELEEAKKIIKEQELKRKEDQEKQNKALEELNKKEAEKKYNQLPEEEKKKIGLGDFVAKFAQPIAKTIDSVAGTNIQNCGGCKKRQEGLNNLVPNIKNPLNNSKTK